MKKIIVPTDFSDGAFNALIHALHHARKLGFTIDVVHAFMMPPTGTAVMVDITDVLKKNAMEELAKLRKRVSALEIAQGIEINYHAEHGSVVDVINRAATKSKDAALVVMGTQGASGITEKWLGSNTAAAARNLTVPLLAIPADKPYKALQKIVFSTDLKQLGKPEVLSVVALLAEKNNAEVKFLHVRPEADAKSEKNGDAFKAQIKSHFGSVPMHFSFVIDSEIEEGIKDAVERESADMLVLVRHEYGFFQSIFHSSVSQEIVNEASLPVLVLKD